MALIVAPGVEIPDSDLAVAFTRSAGPGGQNVNKVASKVELRVDLARIEGLSSDARLRLAAFAAHRLDSAGRLLVVSQRMRDQAKNLADARAKVRALVLRALLAPKARRPTQPASGAKEARLREKRRAGERKAARRATMED